MKHVYVGWSSPTLTRINPEVFSFTIPSSKAYVGNTHEIKLSINPTEPVTYSSSDNSVATVNESGLITFVGKGQVTITATSGKHSKSITITVKLSPGDQLLEEFIEGGKVTLSKDIKKTLYTDKKVTLDLNNKTLTAEQINNEIGSTDSVAIWAKEGADITINGPGKIEALNADYSMAVWAQGGTVTINGGEYWNAGDNCDLIYASAGGKVTINGGTFYATKNENASGTKNEYSVLNLKDNSGSEIIVKGGTFYGFNPADNLSENPRVDFVADGYKSVRSSQDIHPISGDSVDVWVVQKIEPEPEPEPEQPESPACIKWGVIGLKNFIELTGPLLFNGITDAVLNTLEDANGQTHKTFIAGDNVIVIAIPSTSDKTASFDNTLSPNFGGDPNMYADGIEFGSYKIYGQVFVDPSGEQTIIIK